MARRKRRYYFGKKTTYNGVRFRSKLESYVARRFDKYEVEWVYEPERLTINDSWCIPDFYLPEYDVYIEVRPARRVDDKLLDKVRAIQEQHGKTTIIIHHQQEVRGCLAQLSAQSPKIVE